jgi:DNA (cytosine-5)-methyltransferase 1
MLMRNNGSKGDGGEHCTTVGEPARTLTTAGHQSLVTWEHLLVPYYGNGTARPVSRARGHAVDPGPVRPGPRRRRHQRRAVPHAGAPRDRPRHELRHDYTVLGSKRERVRQYGNAVTPNAAEVILCALVEAITGEDIDRYADAPRAVVA